MNTQDDIKITDYLIELYQRLQDNQDYKETLDTILGRFSEILRALGLEQATILSDFEKTIISYIETITEADYLLDALKSVGEDFSAQTISAYLKSIGLDYEYLSPKEAGILVTDQPGNAVVKKETYDNLSQLRETDTAYIMPGFFAYTETDRIVTFSRGGSDISGAIVARGLQADSYENYTDQSNIFSAHPELVDQPIPIERITYSEIRELSYAGFGIFHEEALEPLLHHNIPIIIKNTNQPDQPGTAIVGKRENVDERPIIGVSATSDYMAITIKEYFLNRQVGYLRGVLEVFEQYQVSVDHVPTGIDYISVVMQSNQFKHKEDLDKALENIHDTFNVETLTVEDSLASIALVGEGLHDIVGPTHQATVAFERADIQPRMIIQGASEISMFFIVKEKDKNKAIQALYNQFF